MVWSISIQWNVYDSQVWQTEKQTDRHFNSKCRVNYVAAKNIVSDSAKCLNIFVWFEAERFLICFNCSGIDVYKYKLSCRREIALQCRLVMAKSGRLELVDNIYGYYKSTTTTVTYLASKTIEFGEKSQTAITPFNVIQGHRGRYQSKARMRLPRQTDGHTNQETDRQNSHL